MADQSDKRAELDELLAESKQLFARVEKYLRDLKKAESTCELINDFFDNKWGDAHRVADEIFEVKTRAEQILSQFDDIKDIAKKKLAEINSTKQTVDQQLAEINSAKQIVDQQSAQINSVKQTVDQQSAQINSAKQVADQQSAQINSVKQTVDQQSAQINSVKQVADQQLAEIKVCKETSSSELEAIEKLKQSAHAATADVKEKRGRIAQFDVELFGDGEKSNKSNPGLKQRLHNLYDEQQKKYDGLVTRIENLLPGATAAGLASSFSDAKKENARSNIFLNIGFYGSLLILAVAYGVLYSKILSSEISVTWDLVLFKTTLSFPFAWMAWYCQKAIAETKKTREEYHHKQRVMELYAGFADHIKGLSADDRMSALAQVVLDTVKRNPAEQVKTESDDQLINRFTKIISAVKDLK